jgi:serine/threonine-protein kinase
MSDHSLSAAKRFNARCDAFEQAWTNTAPPDIEAFAQGWEGSQRLALLRELVGIDAERRIAQAGEADLPDYTARFPELADGPCAQLPRTLGQYILLDRVGAGGMGTVYRALHRRMGREVAVKVLRGGADNLAQLRQLFDREIHAAAQLCHPNIVVAYDAGEEDGLPYLVSQFVEGDNLATIVRRDGPLPAGVALDYTLQAARGLRYLHQQGLVHRDVKPANLLLDAHGVVRVLDVGLAGLQASVLGPHDPAAPPQLIGTPACMAPEQAADPLRADARADVYGLGCTLYFLLTGRRLFAAGGVAAQITAHRTSPPPALAGALAFLNPLLSRMLAKRPEHRHASMDAVIRDLERLNARRLTAARRKLLALATVCATTLALAALAWDRSPAPAPPAPAALDAPFDGRAQQDLWAAHLNIPVAVNHASGLSLRLIPPGRCWIGSTQPGIDWMLSRESHPAMRRRISSESRRLATFTTPFYLSTTEVTVGQFRRFVDATGYLTQAERGRCRGYGLATGAWLQAAGYSWRHLGSQALADDHPVCNVTYVDAVAFCDWLTATSGASRFRLPTETEWEYACRAGSADAWPFGQTAGMLEAHAWCRSNAGEIDNLIRPVATRSPNAFGLFDMLGNVQETCVAGSSGGSLTPDLVFKGGNISGGALLVRPAARSPAYPQATEGGFRVVMVRAADAHARH